jgi:hypothetical protein
MEKPKIDTIHVKISYNDEIRRFIFNGTEFTSLKETIIKVLSLNDEFVLKYQDDESDYVTLDGQEDLSTALMISPKMLRISVEKKSSVGSSVPMNPGHGHGHHHGGGRGHHHHNHGGGGRGHHHHHGGHGGNQEWKKIRIEKKLTWVNQCLQELGNDDSKLAPREQWKKQRLLKKQQKLETELRTEATPKKEKRVLTPEEEQFNYSIRLQILEIKAEAAKVKARQRELKMVRQSKPGDKAITDELSALKERKGLLKAQKKDIWEKFKN